MTDEAARAFFPSESLPEISGVFVCVRPDSSGARLAAVPKQARWKQALTELEALRSSSRQTLTELEALKSG